MVLSYKYQKRWQSAWADTRKDVQESSFWPGQLSFWCQGKCKMLLPKQGLASKKCVPGGHQAHSQRTLTALMCTCEQWERNSQLPSSAAARVGAVPWLDWETALLEWAATFWFFSLPNAETVGFLSGSGKQPSGKRALGNGGKAGGVWKLGKQAAEELGERPGWEGKCKSSSLLCVRSWICFELLLVELVVGSPGAAPKGIR